MLHIVLYRPEIPPNTGNIARQCVGMHACLHIVGPIHFDLSDNAVRRAGLDYWNELDLTFYESSEDFCAWLGDRIPWLVTKNGRIRYDKGGYRDDDVLVFGSETRGIPQDWTDKWSARTVYLPIIGNVRNYNLANTVSVVLAHASLKAGIFDIADSGKPEHQHKK
jgi:tRNA (cytidine/uridine-2'-O-)-methyltransferase